MEYLNLAGKWLKRLQEEELQPAAASDTNSKPTEVVTVGSMPIKLMDNNTETRHLGADGHWRFSRGTCDADSSDETAFQSRETVKAPLQ
ncbi:hypothetical protein SDJN02_17773, partial [Cucurbita argyrosperma subsp. argyrosperma]